MRRLVLILAGLLVACQLRDLPVVEKTVIIGDSISMLYADEVPDALHPVSVAKWGTSTLEWRPAGALFARIEAQLPAPWCVVLLGTNDAKVFGGIGPLVHAVWMRKLLGALPVAGCGQVLLLSPPKAALDPQRESLLVEYRAVHRAQCQQMPFVVCGPDLSEILHWPEDYLGDGIHPNPQGEQKIAWAVASSIGWIEAARSQSSRFRWTRGPALLSKPHWRWPVTTP